MSAGPCLRPAAAAGSLYDPISPGSSRRSSQLSSNSCGHQQLQLRAHAHGAYCTSNLVVQTQNMSLQQQQQQFLSPPAAAAPAVPAARPPAPPPACPPGGPPPEQLQPPPPPPRPASAVLPPIPPRELHPNQEVVLDEVAEGEMVENKLVIPDDMLQYLSQVADNSKDGQSPLSPPAPPAGPPPDFRQLQESQPPTPAQPCGGYVPPSPQQAAPPHHYGACAAPVHQLLHAPPQQQQPQQQQQQQRHRGCPAAPAACHGPASPLRHDYGCYRQHQPHEAYAGGGGSGYCHGGYHCHGSPAPAVQGYQQQQQQYPHQQQQYPYQVNQSGGGLNRQPLGSPAAGAAAPAGPGPGAWQQGAAQPPQAAGYAPQPQYQPQYGGPHAPCSYRHQYGGPSPHQQPQPQPQPQLQPQPQPPAPCCGGCRQSHHPQAQPASDGWGGYSQQQLHFRQRNLGQQQQQQQRPPAFPPGPSSVRSAGCAPSSYAPPAPPPCEIQCRDISQSSPGAPAASPGFRGMRHEAYQRTLEYVQQCQAWGGAGADAAVVSSTTQLVPSPAGPAAPEEAAKPAPPTSNMVVNDLTSSLTSLLEENRFLQMIQ